MKFLDRLEEWIIATLMAAATVVIFIAVVHRYLSGLPIPALQDYLIQINTSWAQELCIYMFVWMAKFGAAYGVRTGIHVGVDVLVNRLNPRWRAGFIVFGLLAGLDVPDSGSASVGSEPAVAGHCAYMPQKDLLFPWRTVLDNTILGLQVQGVPTKEARRRAADLFPAFGLAGFEDARPFQLSGGMRQRAALLRTVVQNRDLVLLDEPFAALDALTRERLQEDVRAVSSDSGRTNVFVTHSADEAAFLGSRIIVLTKRPGRIALDLTSTLPRTGVEPDELRGSPEYAALRAEIGAAVKEAAVKDAEVKDVAVA